MTKDEALKLALEALERCVATCFDPYAHEQAMSWPEHFVNQTITAIKEALAQPEQEPVAFINVEQRKLEWAKYMRWDTPTVVNLPKIPLYTTPPQRQWVGLTDKERDEICLGDESIARSIEAKLRDKNGGNHEP
jgi:hypothetical protein